MIAAGREHADRALGRRPHLIGGYPVPPVSEAGQCQRRMLLEALVAGGLGGSERGGQGGFRLLDPAACQLCITELDQQLDPGRVVRGDERAGARQQVRTRP